MGRNKEPNEIEENGTFAETLLMLEYGAKSINNSWIAGGDPIIKKCYGS